MKKRGLSDVVGSEDVSEQLRPTIQRAIDASLSLGSSHGCPRLPWEVNPVLIG